LISYTFYQLYLYSIMPPSTPLNRETANAPLGFGTFDINDPGQSPSGAFYLPNLPDPSSEPEGIEPFPPDVREAWDVYQEDGINRSVLSMKKRAEMREILMHPNMQLRDLFNLNPRVSIERDELARLRNLKTWSMKNFQLSNNQVYHQPCEGRNGQQLRMRYALCENDIYQILCRLHRGLGHGGKYPPFS
jgi:hypothetical protein